MSFLVDESKPKQVSAIDTFRYMTATLLDPVPDKPLGLRNSPELIQILLSGRQICKKSVFDIVQGIDCAERFALFEQAQAC
eukprot:g73771.t1